MRLWSRSLKQLLLVALVLCVALVSSGCIQNPISAKAQDIHRLFYIILWLALPVFLVVWGSLLICVVRFRHRRGDTSEPRQTAGNNGTIALFFIGPLIIITLSLLFGETTLAKVEHPDPPGEHLRITGFQWEWSADYVDHGFTVTGVTNKKSMVMELPVDKPVHVTLLSHDVIHEFYVPQLLFMKNAIPGHPNTFSFTPDKLGTFRGRCAQYCGLWHSHMTFVMKVVTPEAFASWVKHEKKVSSSATTCPVTGSSVEIEAQHIQWNKACLGVVANKPFKLQIENKDVGIAHNFAIYDSPKRKHQYYVTPTITGPAKKTFIVPALKPGTYYFQCNIHGPAMSGTLIVGQPSG